MAAMDALQEKRAKEDAERIKGDKGRAQEERGARERAMPRSMRRCLGCDTYVEPKRDIGILALLLVLATSGAWLLALPLYPQRCPRCNGKAFTKRIDKTAARLPGISSPSTSSPGAARILGELSKAVVISIAVIFALSFVIAGISALFGSRASPPPQGNRLDPTTPAKKETEFDRYMARRKAREAADKALDAQIRGANRD
jgi:hypothetical protein